MLCPKCNSKVANIFKSFNPETWESTFESFCPQCRVFIIETFDADHSVYSYSDIKIILTKYTPPKRNRNQI